MAAHSSARASSLDRAATVPDIEPGVSDLLRRSGVSSSLSAIVKEDWLF
jgi:hypothetical protein